MCSRQRGGARGFRFCARHVVAQQGASADPGVLRRRSVLRWCSSRCPVSTCRPTSRPTVRLLAIQPLLYGILLVAFRHVVRVPAELRANWGIQVAWQGRSRAFANGVQAAALLSMALPAIVAVVPPIAFAGGVSFAAAHATARRRRRGDLSRRADAVVRQGAVHLHLPAGRQHRGPLCRSTRIGFLIGATLFARLRVRASSTANTPARAYARRDLRRLAHRRGAAPARRGHRLQRSAYVAPGPRIAR